MKIAILGGGTTKFGELWGVSPKTLIKEAVIEALEMAKTSISSIDAIYVGNMLSGVLGGQEHMGAFVSSVLKTNAPSFKIEGACASGGLAIHNACLSIMSGVYNKVLVIGIEKMTDYKPEEVTLGLTGASSDEERMAGATFPGLYAIIAREHMRKYGTTEEEMASVAVKNHYHASLNGKAHFTKNITIEQVLRSSKIADPIKLLDSSPVSDGAAAIILTSENSKFEARNSKIFIEASVVATDSIGLSDREDLTSLKAVKIASKKAYEIAKIKPEDIDVAEVHDCFTIAEIIACEDLGFYKKGEAAKKIASGETTIGGKGVIVNASGGLKASGHPVGATGVKQIVEIYKQLAEKAEKKQVKGAKIGLTHNVGGSGGTAVVHILKKVTS